MNRVRNMLRLRSSVLTASRWEFIVGENFTWLLRGWVCCRVGDARIPLRAARGLAWRSLARNPSRDQPRCGTICFGLSAIVLWYLFQFLVLARIANPLTASLWLGVFFAAAHANRLAGGRLKRALERARAFLAFRADPTLQPRLLTAVDALLADTLALE